MPAPSEGAPRDNRNELFCSFIADESVYSQSALRLLTLTKNQVSTLMTKYAGTEHMLFAVLEEPKARIALSTLVSTEKVKMEAESFVIDNGIKGNKIVHLENQIALSERARRIIERAKEEATKTRIARVNSIHILSAIILEEDAVAATILKKLGVTKKDLPKLRKMAKELGDEIPEESVLDKGSIN